MEEKQIEGLKQLNQTTLEELAELKEKYFKKVKDEGQKILGAEFQRFFDANPNVAAVAWTQYTPYWNDGEPCEFGVRDFNYRLKDDGSDEPVSEFRWGEDPPWFTAWGLSYSANDQKYFTGTKELRAKMADLAPAAEVFSKKIMPHEDVLEMAFGDHVKVIATPGKFQVTEIEHD